MPSCLRPNWIARIFLVTIYRSAHLCSPLCPLPLTPALPFYVSFSAPFLLQRVAAWALVPMRGRYAYGARHDDA